MTPAPDPANDWFGRPLSPWRVITTAVVPFWIYLTLNNLLIAQSSLLGGVLSTGPESGIAPPSARLFQHAVLLVVALLCYRWAWRIGWQRGAVLRLLLAHLVIAVGFASISRFSLAVGVYLVGDPSWSTMQQEMRGWTYWMWVAGSVPSWVRSSLEWLFNYCVGLGLVVGLRTWLELRTERRNSEELRRQWLQSRLDTLASQLSPHFLFNSVNTIVALARRDTARAETLVGELADLLRDALRPDRPATTTVEEELRFVQRYLGIESVRFMDRLTVEYAVDPTVLPVRIPSLLLQPIIENAIKHGVSSSVGAATLRISATRVDDQLVLSVENSCAGSSRAEGFGIGLRNVQDRLAAAFPGRHRFEAGSLPDGRWRVLIGIRLEEIG